MTDRLRRRGVPGGRARRRRPAAEPGREVSRVERISRGRRVDDLIGHDRRDSTTTSSAATTHGSAPSVTTTSRAPIARNASAIAPGVSASVSRRRPRSTPTARRRSARCVAVHARASSSSAHNAGRWFGSYTTVPPRSCTAVAYARSVRRPASCSTAMAMPLKHSTSTTDRVGQRLVGVQRAAERARAPLVRERRARRPHRRSRGTGRARRPPRAGAARRRCPRPDRARAARRCRTRRPRRVARSTSSSGDLAFQVDGEVQRVAPEPPSDRSRRILQQLDERLADDQDARHGRAARRVAMPHARARRSDPTPLRG